MKRTVRLGLSAVMGLSAALLAWSAVAGAHAEAVRKPSRHRDGRLSATEAM